MTAPGSEEETATTNHLPVDPLDDVFGSAPASPVLSAEGDNGEESRTVRPQILDPSDIPQLRSTHITNGYREGIATSKEKHLQEGFDEGFSLGAELGMRAGWCLGALEGILHAVSAHFGRISDGDAGKGDEDGRVTTEQVGSMLREAEEELKVQNLCGEQYLDSDGIWRYGVPGQDSDEEASFARVAEAHPVIQKWSDTIHSLSQALELALQ